MKTEIKRCPECGLFTLRGLCPKCQSKTAASAPPRFSPEDKYGEIRRAEKNG